MKQQSIIQLFPNFSHRRIINKVFGLYFLIALLRYNLYAMQFTHLQCIVQYFGGIYHIIIFLIVAKYI